MIKELLAFAKIASTRSIGVRPIEYVNNTVDIGVIHQVMGKLPQVIFYNKEIKKPISPSLQEVDASYKNETGWGKVEVINTKEFYLGEGNAE